jgi:hypothetical protein
MRKADLLASMTFDEDLFIPEQFTVAELKALKAVSSNWDSSNVNQAWEIAEGMRRAL